MDIGAIIPLTIILAVIASVGYILLLLQRLVQAVERIARIMEDRYR